MNTFKPSSQTSRVSAVLMMSTSLTLTSLAFVVPAYAQSPDEAYIASGYTYCDATLLAALWSIDTDQAKTAIGQKIINGIGGNIPTVLAESRAAGNTCGFEDTGYSYDDAEELAAVWHVTVDSAKSEIAHKFTIGYSNSVREDLARARQS